MKAFFVLTLGALLPSLSLVAQTRTALVMGVGDYGGATYKGKAVPDLPGIITADLPNMAAKLESLGFAVTVVSNPTLSEAKTAVDAFSAKLKAAPGVSLFYFSGHGGEYEGKNYLIPKRASIGSKADLSDEALSAQRVLNGMEESGAQVNLVFLDCCREDLGKNIGGAEMQPMRARGSFIGFATRSGDFADPGEEGSPYTRFLLKHLDKPGLSVADMYGYVVKDVKDYTKQVLGEERRPGFYSELEGEPFYFVPASLKTTVAPTMTEAEIERRARELATSMAAGSGGVPSGSGMIDTLGAGRTPLLATKDAPFVNTLGMKFVPVVSYKNGKKVLFSIWETRRQDYAAYVAKNSGVDDSWEANEYLGVPIGQKDDEPVVSVSWEDATAFCAWLTETERATGRIGSSDDYRLPTDVEWSYAVGIGDQEDASATPEAKDAKIADVYPWGTGFPPPANSGNYADSSTAAKFGSVFTGIEGYRDGHSTTAPVGSYEANSKGLYDLGGNVWEWCGDWYNAKQEHRVLRGGSWFDGGSSGLLSSSRYGDPPTYRYVNRGFRLVLVSGG